MVPTLPFLKEKFQLYNQLIFHDSLPDLPIKLGRARHTLGGLRYSKKKTLLGKTVHADFSLTISTHYDLSPSEVEDTLIHEMIHYYIAYHNLKDTSSHGVVFQKWMNEINQRFGRHITIKASQPLETACPEKDLRRHYVCVSELKDGTIGVTVAAQTRVFELWRNLPKVFPIRKMTWYGTIEPYFNRFPRSLKPKIYVVPVEELQNQLTTAIELMNDGRRIYPKPEK